MEWKACKLGNLGQLCRLGIIKLKKNKIYEREKKVPRELQRTEMGKENFDAILVVVLNYS